VTNRILKTLIFATLAVAAPITRMEAQAHPETQTHASPEISLQYTWVRSNAPVAQCDCFSLNGGSFSLAQPLWQRVGGGHLAAVFEATVVHGSVDAPETSVPVGDAFVQRVQWPHAEATTTGSGSYDLTLTVITAGVRYRPLLHSRWNPFGQVLVGVANADGTLVEGNTPAANDATLNFASQVGGGLDYRLRGRLALRVFEANYLLTTTTNGVNDHQNNLSVSTGIVYRFRK
jgi:outer membrane immunogenic protein